jgi:hypothetical protein
MNENLLWIWRVAVLLTLLFIGDSLRKIHREMPSLPHDFDRTIRGISGDVSAMREKSSPKPAREPDCPRGTEDTGPFPFITCTPINASSKK